MNDERGGIISGFLIKLVVVLGLVALLAFEVGAVVVARVQVDGVAVNAAEEAASEYGRSADIRSARAAAAKICTESGAQLLKISVSRDGATISVTVRKVAKTLLVQHISTFAHWRFADSTHEAGVH